jgi:hypothetical protein
MHYRERQQPLIDTMLIALLSEEEFARVNTPHAAARLSEADEYLDLEQLDRGVQRGPVAPRPICRLLPRSAVRESTWAEILGWLHAMQARQFQRRAGRMPRGARLGESRLTRRSMA